MPLVSSTLPLSVAALAGVFATGLFVGHVLFLWTIRLTDDRPPAEAGIEAFHNGGGRPSWWFHFPLVGPWLSRRGKSNFGVRCVGWVTLVELLTGALFAAFVVAKLRYRCQSVPEVQPSEFWHYGRIVYHLVLISLLITASGTDFRHYVIPDGIVVPGIVIAVGMATLSGDLQTIHVWVDWHYAVPGIRGPYLPEWMKTFPHLHGLVWSITGMVVGAGMVWIVRAVSSWMLGREAMGFGDVTLMAMIGSFVGWQPVLIILTLSPLCGLVMAVFVRLLTRKIVIPFGPFLAVATLVVLFSWRWIWMFELPLDARQTLSLRILFSDLPGLLILLGIALAALVLLLGLLRLYRKVPGKRRTPESRA